MISSPFSICSSLQDLDDKLSTKETIVLAGSVVPILSGHRTKNAKDIDFAVLPSEVVRTAVQSDTYLSTIFDFTDAGHIGLFLDVEDRLVQVAAPFHKLTAYYVSVRDWVVSLLDSPKISQVLFTGDLTSRDLNWIESNFYKYVGTDPDKAYKDLLWLKEEFSKRKW